MEFSPLLAIASSKDDIDEVNAIALSLGYEFAETVLGTPADAADKLREGNYSPKYIVIFIGERDYDVIPEIDSLAEQCESGTRVVVIGITNDIKFYRAIIDQGVSEYFTSPISVEDVTGVLLSGSYDGEASGKVMSFVGGASGDGSTTVALNVAYLLAKEHKKRVVMVDLDYQFGMLARQLELRPSYGMKEIIEYPERGVDKTLLSKMVLHYRDGLDIITSPQSLHFMPAIEMDLIRDFISQLSTSYDYVILDLPHQWSRWISATISLSDQVVLVSQLLLKSITHTSRMLSTWADVGLLSRPVSLVVNRSGSRYKEALHPKDFERIIDRKIDFYLPNDIKTVSQSESRGVPVDLIGKSQLSNELKKMTKNLIERDNVR